MSTSRAACAACGRTDVRALYPCTGCGDARARYCGEACQQVAWDAGHALACGPMAIVSRDGTIDANVLRKHVVHALATVDATVEQAEIIELGQELCQGKLHGPEDVDDALWFLAKVESSDADSNVTTIAQHKAQLEAQLMREFPHALIPHNPVKYAALRAQIDACTTQAELIGGKPPVNKTWLKAEQAKRGVYRKEQYSNLHKSHEASLKQNVRQTNKDADDRIRAIRKGRNAENRGHRATNRTSERRGRRQLRSATREEDAKSKEASRLVPPSGIRYRLESHAQAAKPRNDDIKSESVRRKVTFGSSSSDEDV